MSYQTILEQIAAYTRDRVRLQKEEISLDQIRHQALSLPPGRGEAFYRAMEKPGLSVICEVKKASPSKGIIDPVFDYQKAAADYTLAGADAISCLTEPRWFLGSDRIFQEIRALTDLPMLRKDFVVDEYQIWQARLLGADCILLICALLDTGTIRSCLEICRALGLAALVEAHDGEEISSALRAGARMIGVNNRNLKDFSVDFSNAGRLRGQIPQDCIFVAESGVRSAQDAALLKEAGADAILVGEALMRAEDKGALLRAMKEAAG